LGDLATMCGMLKVALPSAKIAVIGAAANPKRWAQREVQVRFNRVAADYCAQYGHDFIDVWTPMLGDYGLPSRDIYVEDDLHMNAAGYVLWQAIVGPYLLN
jgi:lysophospholipase L1-like esterase